MTPHRLDDRLLEELERLTPWVESRDPADLAETAALFAPAGVEAVAMFECTVRNVETGGRSRVFTYDTRRLG